MEVKTKRFFTNFRTRFLLDASSGRKELSRLEADQAISALTFGDSFTLGTSKHVYRCLGVNSDHRLVEHEFEVFRNGKPANSSLFAKEELIELYQLGVQFDIARRKERV